MRDMKTVFVTLGASKNVNKEVFEELIVAEIEYPQS